MIALEAYVTESAGGISVKPRLNRGLFIFACCWGISKKNPEIFRELKLRTLEELFRRTEVRITFSVSV